MVSMTNQQFQEHLQIYKRVRRWLETSEVLILAALCLWGVQLAVIAIANYRPHSGELKPYMFATIYMPGCGVLPIVLAILHTIGIVIDNSGWRRRCIGTELCVFLYVFWSLVDSRHVGLDLIAASVFLVFSLVNYYTLIRPLE